MYGSLDVSKVLISLGSLPNIANNLGETPLHQACENSLYQISELLLTSGADPNYQQTDGNTPLHNSVLKKNKEICELLLKHGANPNIHENLVSYIQFGKTCLHLSIENKCNEITNLLLKFGGDQNLQDFSGNYARNKHKEIVLEDSDDEEPAPKAQTVYSIQNYKENNDLFIWLQRYSLENVFNNLYENGFRDLASFTEKMSSEDPLLEKDLKKMNIMKKGIRLRLIYKINDEIQNLAFPDKKTKQKILPDLRRWLEEARIVYLYDNLVSEGFFFIEDLIRLDKSKNLKDTMKKIGIRDRDINKLISLVYKIETEVTERSIDAMKKFENNKMFDCGICCAFKNIFS